MGIKEFFFGRYDKGPDCQDDPETGTRICRAMIRSKNAKYATGSEWNLALDKSCHAHLTGRTSIFEDDEEIVKKTMKQAEADCKGGIN